MLYFLSTTCTPTNHSVYTDYIKVLRVFKLLAALGSKSRRALWRKVLCVNFSGMTAGVGTHVGTDIEVLGGFVGFRVILAVASYIWLITASKSTMVHSKLSIGRK